MTDDKWGVFEAILDGMRDYGTTKIEGGYVHELSYASKIFASFLLKSGNCVFW